MSASNYRDIPLDLIDIDENRARPLDTDWVEVLAESIAEQGLLNAITIRPIGKRYKLISGGHRLDAVKLNGSEAITCHVRDYGDKNITHVRLEEITENVIRNGLNALDTARSLFELDAIYKELYPGLKQGGNRTGADAENQTALNAVRAELYEKVGLGERAFRTALAIWKGLSAASRGRIYGTWLADHRASLMVIAAQKPASQKKLLDILFPKTGEPKADNMPDALYVLKHGRLLDHRESKFDKVIKVTKTLKPKELELVFEAHVVQIMRWLETRDKD